jgi:signal transduction histidine kinase
MPVRLRTRLTRLAVRPHLPRRTVRLRLTLLYGGLFLASGAALLAITYILVLHATNGYVFTGRNGVSGGVVSVGSPNAAHHGQQIQVQSNGLPGAARLTPKQAEAQARRFQALANEQRASEQHQLLIQSGIALAVMAAVSIALGWIVAGRVLRPLRTITTTARHISATSLHERLALEGPNDELKELGDTIDALLARLDASFQSQRRFVANASHELRTPLARQRTLAQVALSDPHATAESLRVAHERVLASGAEQERLIEALLTLARGQSSLRRREQLDLAAITDQILLTRRLDAADRGLDLHAALSSAPMAGDPRLIERLVDNVIDNALRYNVPDGRIEVATVTRVGQAVLSVLNTGPVVQPTEVDQLFQPFTRVGADRTAHRDGVGLGLSIVQAIADAHEAVVAVDPQPDGGLWIEVNFPGVSAHAQPDHIESRHRVPAGIEHHG